MVYQIKQSQLTGLDTVYVDKEEKITGHFAVTHKNTVFNCGIQFTGWNIFINLNDFKCDRGHKILMLEIINFLNFKNLINV
jgi:hypothetical protein